MTDLRALVVTARTATLLVAPPGVAYRQPEPMPWQLVETRSGAEAARGAADSAVVFLDGLSPATEYRLQTGLGALAFRTGPCAGLVDLRDHGGRADAPDNAAAFARAIAAVPEGGTLRVPAGRFTSGPIFLKPRMTLLLDAGAEIAAIHDRSGWPILPARDEAGRVIGTWEGLPDASFAALVTAVACHGLAITGRGVVDGGGDRGDWWTWPKERRNGARRPRVIQISHSDDVSLSGFAVGNAPSWTVHPYRCRRLRAAGLIITNPPDSPNTDGFNPESCEAVEITGLDISVGDDCIAIKAGKRDGQATDHLAPTRDIIVRHCRMQRGHGAVVLGSEMSGGIENVTVDRCEFIDTDRGLRLKTRRGRGGVMRNICLSDSTMSGVHTPLVVNAFYFCDPDGSSERVQSRAPAPVDETTPRVENVRVERVTARGVALAAAAILGLPEAPVRGVRLTDYRVSYDPAALPGIPLMAAGVEPVAQAGLLASFAEVEGAPVDLEPEGSAPPC